MVENVSFDAHPVADRVLTPEAVEFLVDLHRRFEAHRRSLLVAREHAVRNASTLVSDRTSCRRQPAFASATGRARGARKL